MIGNFWNGQGTFKNHLFPSLSAGFPHQHTDQWISACTILLHIYLNSKLK